MELVKTHGVRTQGGVRTGCIHREGAHGGVQTHGGCIHKGAHRGGAYTGQAMKAKLCAAFGNPL